MSWKKAALVVGLAIAARGTAGAADRITPPAVPEGLEVSAPYKPFLVGHAVGTQNWICVAAATQTGGEWFFIGPQATVFNADLQQIITHFHSKNPDQDDDIQATWQYSRDSSAVWATKFRGSSDPNYVAPGAIEWLLLQVTGNALGPTGGDKLAGTKFIQRVNTMGGMKPNEFECSVRTINTRRFVNYEADYYFYQ
jgi:hypothetical protein